MLRDIILTLPLITVSAGALMLLLLDTCVASKRVLPYAAGWFLVVAIGFCAINWTYAAQGQLVYGGFLYVDPLGSYLGALILGGTLLAIILGAERIASEKIDSPGPYYALILFSIAGALLMVAAAELIIFFVGLEILSLALYCLAGAAVSVRRSVEASLKYFMLGSFSSAVLLYGIALIYGTTGSTFIPDVNDALLRLDSPVLLFGMGLVLIGLLFKVGAVPFHFWVPDVYQGSPTQITAWMACVIKAAAFGGLVRVVWGAFGHSVPFWSQLLWLVAVLSMTLGNLAAIRQRSLKRMLAYSSIAHAGYLLVGVLANEGLYGGGAALLYYLVVYTLMTLGAFGVVMAVTSNLAGHEHPDDISRFSGLSASNPFLAGSFAVFLLALAGLPPGFGGLVGKFFVFNAAIKADYIFLAVIGVLNSAVSCFYYLRVVVAMYFMEAQFSKADCESCRIGPSLAFVLGLCVLGVIVLGIFPGYLYSIGQAAFRGW